MMNLTLEKENPIEVAQFLSDKIVSFNHQHWPIKEKLPVAITYRDENNSILAGVSGITFGHWLHLERLWVDDKLRGQGIGEKLLLAIELKAKERQCKFVIVDTLEFQAKPFYEKNGYHVEFEQKQYPLTGTRTYLTKQL